MSVFVTVGSTSFDELIKTVCSGGILSLLAEQNFNKITLQIGRGTVVPEQSPDINVEWFTFKDDISDYIKNASLIIGHAGAGTILESLTQHKQLIAVLNEALMDNHQTELAQQLADDGYLRYCTCANLHKTLKEHFVSQSLVKFYSDPFKFANFIRNVMGMK